jgi:hypothetical protein
LQVTLDLGGGIRVALLDGKRKQFARILQASRDLVQTGDDLLEPGTLLAECLSPLGLVPDIRLLQLALDFDQSLGFLIVVKDTSSTRPSVQ